MTLPRAARDAAHAGHPNRAEIEAERRGWYEVVSLVRSLAPGRRTSLLREVSGSSE
jgi:hypothetical protein